MPAKLVYTPDEGGQGSQITLPMSEGTSEEHFNRVVDRAGERFARRWGNGLTAEYINIDEQGAETVVFSKAFASGGNA